MCNELQKRIWVVAMIHPATAGEIASILSVSPDDIDSAIGGMDRAGLMLAEDDNGKLSAHSVTWRPGGRVDIDLTVWTQCRAIVRAHLQQMTFEDALSQVGNDSGDTVSPENATK